jgi:hypothetical protein
MISCLSAAKSTDDYNQHREIERNYAQRTADKSDDHCSTDIPDDCGQIDVASALEKPVKSRRFIDDRRSPKPPGSGISVGPNCHDGLGIWKSPRRRHCWRKRISDADPHRSPPNVQRRSRSALCRTSYAVRQILEMEFHKTASQYGNAEIREP